MDTLTKPKLIKARKGHNCDNCYKNIYVGEQHYMASYADGRKVFTWCTCLRCKPYVDEAFNNKGYDWTDGMTGEDFHEYMRNEHPDIATVWWDE